MSTITTRYAKYVPFSILENEATDSPKAYSSEKLAEAARNDFTNLYKERGKVGRLISDPAYSAD